MKKKYTKPTVKKNPPLVNITFASTAPGIGGPAATTIVW